MIATNAPWLTLRSAGPPIAEDGLAIEIVGHSADVRPVAGLPGIRDADVNVRISGRSATINVGRGNVEISAGRKLSITNGVFEVPDTHPKSPPAKVRFRLDGSVPAAAELLANERLREHSGAPLDPATSRGTLTAQVTLALPLKRDLAPGSSIYTINLDVLNFAAERMVMGQKVESALLKVTANNHGYWIRGDVKLHGVPAALDYRKPRDGDAEVRAPGRARRERAQQARGGSQRLPRRDGAGQAAGADCGSRRGQPLRGRGRPDPGQDRQSFPGLVQSERADRPRDLHARLQACGHSLRGSGSRSDRNVGQGNDRGRLVRRALDCQFARIPAGGRRQGLAQGGSRGGWDAANNHARRAV